MNYLYRLEPDGYTNFSMLLVWTLLAVSFYFTYKSDNKRKLLKFLIPLGLIFQLLLFSWYFVNNKVLLQEGLPLYHCRISMFLIAFSYYTNKKTLKEFFGLLGLFGVLIAFAIPDPSKYLFPHITNFTYIGAHIVLFLVSYLVLIEEKLEISNKDILKISVVMNGLIFGINKIVGANYSYLVKLPFSFPLPGILLITPVTILGFIGVMEFYKRKLKIKE